MYFCTLLSVLGGLGLVGWSQGAVLEFLPMAENNAWPPKFCKGLDCPKYSVVESTKDYEVRKYDVSHWVTTEAVGMSFSKAQREMFWRLFGYISGKNVKKEKIAMTVPVINRIIPGAGPACENNFTMSFFLSDKVTDPPKPNDPKASITTITTMKVYVRSFGGFANLDKFLKHAQALAEALPKEASYHTDFYYVCGYDSPFTLFNRHNEVWFVAKE